MANHHNQQSQAFAGAFPFLTTIDDSLQELRQAVVQETIQLQGAYDDMKLVGFIQYEFQPKYGSISRLYVLESYRGQGIARQLMTAALACFAQKEITTIQLQVLPENEAAQTLYRHFGFQPRLLTMTRSLTPSHSKL